MKHYQRKITLDKDYSDGTKATPRKYFNSAERQHSKREIKDSLDSSIEDKEIKIAERYDLERALDRKFESIRFRFAQTLHNLNIPMFPGGDKTNFDYYWHHCDFECEYDYRHLTEAELLEHLALQLESNSVIDVDAILQRWERNRYR